ncbi:MAG TPA: PPOX class F420-dependent oxidoreductase [Acidimicrobiia bacterium]|nr:PPOX class F420-dependent oxidoreductase [Acidimicrobiia bacterium]
MHIMSEEEWRAFLTAAPARTGKLATTRKDGRPHVAPIWYDLDDDGTIVFTTGAESLKGRSIRRDPRVSLCVDDERPPFSFVIVEGAVEISEDLDDLLVWATRIGGRYMGAEHADAFGRRNAVPGELLLRLRPAHVVAQAAIAD